MLIVKETLLNTKSGKREFAKTPLSPMCVFLKLSIFGFIESVAAQAFLFSQSGTVVVSQRLSCSDACGIFPIRDPTRDSCIGRQILSTSGLT